MPNLTVHERLRIIGLLLAILLLSLSISVDNSTRAAQSTATQTIVKEQEVPSLALPDEQRADSDARARADLAINAFQVADSNALWRTLQRGADPAVRAYVIDRLPASAVNAQAIADRLRGAGDAGERAALILTLGGLTEEQLPRSRRKSVTMMLLRLYKSDPDPEVHSAIDWLLRHRNDHPDPAAFFQEDYPFTRSSEGASQPRIEWGQRDVLEAIDRELATNSPHRVGWAINSQGHTMITIRAEAFQMGSPSNEPRRDRNENLHPVRIPRTFAISAREVSVSQFQRYLGDTGRRTTWNEALIRRFPRNASNFTAWPENPQFAMTWYDAVAYCNWLSKKEGIPHQQWVYPDEIRSGMVLPANYLHRTGYRLATEAEWEFAARAGTTTARFFGDGVALLDRYAWFMANSENHGWPTGTTKPNQFGLFDVYGNAWEWVQDRFMEYPKNVNQISIDNEDTELVVTDDAKRIRRGGSYSYDKETMRAAHRGAPQGYQLNNRMDSVGFRVARTLPTS